MSQLDSIFIIFQVHQRVIMPSEMYKVDHGNGNPLCFKHSAQIPRDLPFTVQNYVGALALKQIGFYIVSGFTAATSTNHHYVEIVLMPK